jgi:TetR/AcrR family transcriptional regulator, cholesterol catabolism regulator
MQDASAPLVEKIRKHLSAYQPDQFSLSTLANDLNQPIETLIASFGNEAGLVEEVLEYEQKSLEAIFSNFDFAEVNAIDGLLFVSKEISKRFSDIQPSINFDLRKYYPEVHQNFFDKRVKFVFDKIRRNIEQGIQHGLYRQDLSTELVSRIYISRLIDLHNPDFFPNDEISFNTLFDVMFDTFIRGICNEEGIRYYEKKVKCMKFQSS